MGRLIATQGCSIQPTRPQLTFIKRHEPGAASAGIAGPNGAGKTTVVECEQPVTTASAPLATASVRITSTNARDNAGGRAIGSRKISGTAGYGDSGGPQFHGDKLVGVCSTGDYVNTQYASITANRSWIRSVAGV